MRFDERIYNVRFQHSKERADISLRYIGESTISFLDMFGVESLVGEEFYSIIGDGDGETKFEKLLEATQYQSNPYGFFSELIKKIETSNHETGPVNINGVEMPYRFLVSTLTSILPEEKLKQVKNVSQLERLTNLKVPLEERERMQDVIETYPVRFSMHTVRQMRFSQPVAYQYMPFLEELDQSGFKDTWVGQFHKGIVEQMYQNRVITLLNMTCPVYCRFCFRKHKDCRDQKSPTTKDVVKAAKYIAETPSIKEIVLTGGDCFTKKAVLKKAIEEYGKIPHVQTLRVATRSVSYYPDLFYRHNNYWLNYLKKMSYELGQHGKKIELATHFIHPDEVSIESLQLISDFVKNGVPIYIQTPFLNDCNDQGPELVELYNKLRGAGAEIHYIFMPCSPIQGNSIYWSTISSGIETARHLRGNLSDRAIPHLCTATSIGKIDWFTSGWAVEKSDEDSIWIRTPYTAEYFKSFAPLFLESEAIRENKEGTLDAKFMAPIGDETLFLGSRKSNLDLPLPAEDLEENLEALVSRALYDQRDQQSIVNTDSSTLHRIHKTRVELDINAPEEEMEYNLQYLRKNKDVTDIVVTGKDDVIGSISKVKRLMDSLEDIEHVNAIRLRSLGFNYSPEKFTREVITRLGEMNKLRVANPKRIEIETQFMHSTEFDEIHRQIVDNFRRVGISVYNNTPLLSDINDNAEEMQNISYFCRELGMEFQHLYLTGTPIQEEWSQDHKIDLSRVIDIATMVRKNGSGREVPRYMLRTKIGESDFGLSSQFLEMDKDGKLWTKLLPYDQEYFKTTFENFELPEDVKLDKDGKPIIPLEGIKNLTTFLTNQ